MPLYAKTLFTLLILAIAALSCTAGRSSFRWLWEETGGWAWEEIDPVRLLRFTNEGEVSISGVLIFDGAMLAAAWLFY